MSERFVGKYYNSIDQKNRIIVPSKHRELLKGKCFVAKGLDKCLNIYTVERWEAQMEKLDSLPQSDKRIRAFIRSLSGNAVECNIDSQGRIVITDDLMEYAGITKELVTIGSNKVIEIWDRNLFNEVNDNAYSEEEIAEALNGLY
ncbi:MAG: division/cell wall cluster transcriptional repressor MraZ [Peptostreptococcaceae bacterium]|nr:division/cell wall cluster transcriptional repressor MraZ [Peptostreptococcaceae bacterium]